MYRIIALFLIMLLPLAATPAGIPAKAAAIGVGSPVRVQLAAKRVVDGKLMAVTSDAVVVQVANGNTVEERTYAFSEIRSIHQAGKTSKGAVIAAIVIIWGVLAGLSAAIGG